MSSKKRTAREELERAMWVSFKMPEEADRLLDAYRDELREEFLAEAVKTVTSTPCPIEAEKNWHWFVFALNRAAHRLDPRREMPF